ncbi:bifunctional 3-dehydroquinate dehydratase/shikimate dehydrogenase, chloroplastic-like isoform X2 [Olea europaea var. sylvestris]|uniref:bifunctional 3-dehydroquinate dehydratase/shikimate dehydrogenase, chloroplastic-like isoform X1 n=1 Tax=Olea europaea var. sylvestris TaxID=158386 RepID=UPI000C1CFC70|nr:bifunctional 3-dehydroquinate dehydratase/shikimate dehydrogenase, chloroplastic-like isoform X1 [Olea europaea var. sylvestris]XP_022844777.1 bifunctional 3-dehydroquinate dehydratase/shikimate dehydrogenase, chloroplastic-like isoform X2 [Olea europaea var. sylvestris]
MGFKSNLLVYTSLECESKEEMVASMQLAKDQGADLVELCIGSMSFSHISEIEQLLKQRILPSIVSFRHKCPTNPCRCLQVFKMAIEFDTEFVEIDVEMATEAVLNEFMRKRSNTKIIVSGHLNGETPTTENLGNLIIDLQSTGADVIKLVVDVSFITDVAPIFHMLTHCQVPLIARAVGDRGLISQLLGPKYGAFLVCGSIGDKFISGLPPLGSIKQVYKLEYMNSDTQIFGLVSNPVGHSKGPLLHNPAFRHTGYNGIYVPLLVDNVEEFFKVYSCNDFTGFSVGIPHKEAVLKFCDEVHPLAQSIGAANTIVRSPTDGKLVGYNTDCEACITAIEDAFRERRVANGQVSNASPLAGKLFVLVGAGGAGRAIAFGARSRGARLVIFNRSFERAKALAKAVSGEALPYEFLKEFCPEKGMILANASAVGMEPNVDQTPIPKVALKSYELVFDAVYTPRNTRLLQEAADVGAIVVSGVEMFIRQALGQFKLFTGGLAPEDFMRKIVLEQF